MLLFNLDHASTLAPALAAELGLAFSAHEDRGFEDGEHKLRPLVDPRGQDSYVLCGLHGDERSSPHDKLCALLMFAATLREHGAARVTALVPYLAYARKDRQTKPFDPVTLRYVAQMFEAVGVDQLIWRCTTWRRSRMPFAALRCTWRRTARSTDVPPHWRATARWRSRRRTPGA
jgi:ribose-phosphate pyrophosphokinase